jgi:hypothetical protein
MGQTAKAPRQNRTITVDFQDPSIYFELLSNGKAFVEFVLALRAVQPPELGVVKKVPEVGGLHRHYERIAA